jgi:hypothetical protein
MKSSQSGIMKVLDDLGFSSAQNAQGRSSIADLCKPQERCGIYVLHFANDEFYAGQAVDVTRRYVQHRNTHHDIVKLSFQRVDASCLNEVARNVIWQLEQNEFPLRNVVFTSLPKGESDFDFLMPSDQQTRWLEDLDFVDGDGERLIDPDLRRRFHGKYQRLLQMPHAESMIDVLKTYVSSGIPAIRRGEVSFWSVSCLPKHDVYSRLNIYWQEVLTAFVSEGNLWFSFHLAASPLEKVLEEQGKAESSGFQRVLALASNALHRVPLMAQEASFQGPKDGD